MEEIYIDFTSAETRAVLLEDNVVQEIYVERRGNKGLVGNIYVGKVIRVLPGMQAAFIDIGSGKAAFLHASDILINTPLLEDLSDNELGCLDELSFSSSITDILTENKEVLVQVIKDEIGSKGARLTTKLSLPARYLVLMPELQRIGVSKRITDKAEAARLEACLAELIKGQEHQGYIIRTVAEGVSQAELAKDLQYLHKLWQGLQEKLKQAKAANLIHADLPIFLRVLRDVAKEETSKIKLNDKQAYKQSKEFAKRFVPGILDSIEYYNEKINLFDNCNIEEEIKTALDRKVKLKSGGYLIFDRTEAMTTIDVNTGSFVGSINLEETIFKTNLEAAHAIARQIRLRNIGGIIIIDFIDMDNLEHKNLVMSALHDAMGKDGVKNNISEISSLGLVQMTRKRTRESLDRILCGTCEVCSGSGKVKTAETVCYEILRDISRTCKAYKANMYLVLASEQVVDRMLEREHDSVLALEQEFDISVKFRVEEHYTHGMFDIVLS